MSKDLILSIDNGTQSLKAIIFDLNGDMVAIEKIPFEPYFSKNPGWAEQDPDMYWQTLCAACKGLWDKQGIDQERIAGMSVTTQRGTVINVDINGKPLRPAILWLDQRKTSGLPPIGGLWGLLFKVAGVSEMIAIFQREAEANWIKKHQPDIWRRTHKYLLLSGWLTYKLTNEFRDSIGCQVGYIPFDYKKHTWAGPRDWKWKGVSIEPELLPELTKPGETIGRVSAEASAQTGIPEGLPVIAAAADKACEILGSGTLDTATGCLSFGTTATINVTSPKYVEAIPLIPPYPSAVTGYYSLEIMVYRGFWMVSWFKNEFGHAEMEKAKNMGIDAEVLFDRLIDDVPPGCMGLMLQPYWSPGLKIPGSEAKGAIIGFGDIHNKGYVYRSILEGLVYALREGKERIEKRTGIPITDLRVSGGGSQSRNAMQVTADIFNLPTARPHLYETSGLGAAITAAVGLGLHRDFNSAIGAMTRPGDVFEPDAKNRRLYDELYQRVYKKMYKRLRPLYQDIREITGYPEGV
jgi:sugar (pentulose or hexulose) kinase